MMELLIKRNKTVEIFALEQNRLLLQCSLADEVHEMNVSLIADADGFIISAEAEMKRTPYEICRSAAGRVQSLVGLKITDGKQAKNLLHNEQGCEHLSEIVLDALRAYLPAMGNKVIAALTEQYRSRGLPVADVQERVRDDLMRLGQGVVTGRCIVYNSKNK
ncbi:MAG: DUF2889 domain-containing protein [Bacillota bacterium]|nr:DUF2889 domain-containing protein [Bacillota bacterium]MDW7683769.1 DUF2889 domain-containing protein [Bacillota bacterium]